MEENDAENYRNFFSIKKAERISPHEAIKLAQTLSQNLEKKGYIGFCYELAYETIRTAHITPETTRMQFKLASHDKKDKGHPYIQQIRGPQGEEVELAIQRVIKTELTDYRPSPIVRGLKEWNKAGWEERVRGFSPDNFARIARESYLVREVLDDAVEHGIKFALTGTYKVDNADSERGYVLHDRWGKIIQYTQIPWIIVPGTTIEQRAKLDKFSEELQIPNKKLIDKITGITD